MIDEEAQRHNIINAEDDQEKGGVGARLLPSPSTLWYSIKADKATLYAAKKAPPVDKTYTGHPGNPSLFWTEKFMMSVHVLQLYAVMWQAAEPWGAPYLWSLNSQWINWVNLDYFSTTAGGALIGSTADLNAAKWGEMANYPPYALGFAVAPYLLLAAVRSVWPFLDMYGMNLRRHKHWLVACLLLVLQLAYLPVSLAVFRLYYCDANKDLGCDRDVPCSGAYYTAFTFVCTLLVAPLYLGLPLLLYYLIAPNAVYRLSRDHEKRLQASEISYELGLDTAWLAHQLWLGSSFHRKRVFLPVQMLALKAVVLFLFVFARDNYIAQACLMWLACTAASLYWVVKWPYRVHSSNYWLFALLFTLFVLNTYYAMDAFGVVNPFMVSSAQFFGMLVFFSFGVLCLLLISLDAAVLHRDRHYWPSSKTLSTLLTSDESHKRVRRWIQTLRTARDMRFASFLAPDETIDIGGIEESIRRLRKCWLGARARGSLFEVILSDALDQLLQIHCDRYPRALRKNEGWEQEAKGLAQATSKRAETLSMVSQRNKRILLKVLALRAFRGHMEDVPEGDEFDEDEGSGDQEDQETEGRQVVAAAVRRISLLHRQSFMSATGGDEEAPFFDIGSVDADDQPDPDDEDGGPGVSNSNAAGERYRAINPYADSSDDDEYEPEEPMPGQCQEQGQGEYKSPAAAADTAVASGSADSAINSAATATAALLTTNNRGSAGLSRLERTASLRIEIPI